MAVVIYGRQRCRLALGHRTRTEAEDPAPGDTWPEDTRRRDKWPGGTRPSRYRARWRGMALGTTCGDHHLLALLDRREVDTRVTAVMHLVLTT